MVLRSAGICGQTPIRNALTSTDSSSAIKVSDETADGAIEDYLSLSSHSLFIDPGIPRQALLLFERLTRSSSMQFASFLSITIIVLGAYASPVPKADPSIVCRRELAKPIWERQCHLCVPSRFMRNYHESTTLIVRIGNAAENTA